MDVNWKESIIEKLSAGWRYDSSILFSSQWDGQAGNENRQVFVAGNGCSQRVRSKDKLQAGFYDLESYRKIIKQFVADLPKNSLIIDMGCGDGRIVEVLLGLGFTRIIALDFNSKDLESLWGSLDVSDRHKVLPVCASITESSLLSGEADAVIMLEVAYTLKLPIDAYRNCNTWLHKDGRALISNVGIEAYFVHALLNGDWEQVARIAERGRYEEKIGSNPIECHLFNSEDMGKLAELSGFKRLFSTIVSAGPGLLIHALRKNNQLTENKISLLEKVAAKNLGISRVHVDILQKATDNKPCKN
ncbi:hypothetical protein BROC_02283 [Candidatus Brocadiaceae bacterium]|nr:hypothetical protein BROC_02283 [Candidatus Brocadiaceae bacterium]